MLKFSQMTRAAKYAWAKTGKRNRDTVKGAALGLAGMAGVDTLGGEDIGIGSYLSVAAGVGLAGRYNRELFRGLEKYSDKIQSGLDFMV